MTTSQIDALKGACSFPSLALLAWRRKWWLAAATLICAAAGGTFGWLRPKNYLATALVLVEPQKVPDKYVSSAVSTDVQDRLATISQQILSNTRLQKIIDDFHLYAKEKKRMYPEEILDLVRSNITIKLEKGWTRDRPGAFHVSYEGSEPAIVAEVVNRIVSLFLEENLRERENSAEGTADFLQGQLQDARRKLEEQELKLAEYKLQHKGELPGQEAFLTGTLSRLQVELEGALAGIARARQERTMIQSALKVSEETSAIVSQMAHADEGRQQGTAAPVQKESDALKAELDGALERYTPNHPAAAALARRLEAAQAKEKADGAAVASRAVKPSPVSHDTPQKLQARLQATERTETMQTQLRLLDEEIASRGKQREEVLSKIADFQKRLEQLPVRELQMGGITRDYEMAMANYRSLQDKQISAQMSTEMERRQKGESFQVLDPARVPQKPRGLPVPAIAGIGAGVGLLLSSLIVFGMGLQRNVMLGEWELPPGVPVLARVPFIEAEVRTDVEPDKQFSTRLRPAMAGGAGSTGGL